MNTNELVAKNFKFLCKYHDDKQEYLVKLLGVGQSTISDYWNAKKPIPVDVLEKIAIRYNVTIDILTTEDLAAEYDTPQTITSDDTSAFADKLYPIRTSDVAKTNDNFNIAYESYFKVFAVDKAEDLLKKVSEFEHIISLFQKAWEESQTYVALSNSVICILIIYSCHNDKSLRVGQELASRGKMSYSEIKSTILQDPRKGAHQNIYEHVQRALFDKYEETVYDNINLLKSNPKFSALGDYLLALTYVAGFAEDFITLEQSYQSGFLHMIQLAKLDNKYAVDFIENYPGIS